MIVIKTHISWSNTDSSSYIDNTFIQGFEPYDTIIIVVDDMDWMPPTACVVTNLSQLTQIGKSYTYAML